MKFILKNQQEEKRPTFGDVKVGQFFVGDTGMLFQKQGDYSSNRIADEDGKPSSLGDCFFNFGTEILRICDEVERIEF